MFRFIAVLCAIQTVACSRFVWHEEPFTPDPAPASDVLVSGRDTTYVLRAPSYYLLSSQRNALWNREVLDDIAWRYRALFGESPPMIAVRIDSIPGTDTATTFRGVPLARVFTHRQPADPLADRNRDDDRYGQDSLRARICAGPVLAATTAQAWLGARPSSTSLPAWIEIGALRILGSGGAPDRAAMELRANKKGIVPLATLFATQRPGPNAAGVTPLFMAQAVSVLAFMHDRDPDLVGRLADRVPRGESVESVLATSTVLPHDVNALDAAWKEWLVRRQTRRTAA